MQNYPNYSRQLYDSYFTDLCSVTKLKKKDILGFMKSKSVSDSLDTLLNKVKYAKSFYIKTEYLEATASTYEYLHRFPEALHFVLLDKPEEFTNVKLFDKIKEDTYVIDFRYKGRDYLLEVIKLGTPAIFSKEPADDEPEFNYVATLYADIPELYEDVSAVHPELKRSVKFSHLTELYVSVGSNCHTYVCPWYLGDICTGYMDITSRYDLPSGPYICNVISHVLKCYHDREVITHKSAAANRIYNKSQVAIRTKSIQDAGDKYVTLPLHCYVKEYRTQQRREHLGGTHASPVAHVRRGHFRKSRGKGDYELVNGEFVKVGKGQGHYSFVKAASVNAGKETTNVTIYKV